MGERRLRKREQRRCYSCGVPLRKRGAFCGGDVCKVHGREELINPHGSHGDALLVGTALLHALELAQRETRAGGGKFRDVETPGKFVTIYGHATLESLIRDAVRRAERMRWDYTNPGGEGEADRWFLIEAARWALNYADAMRESGSPILFTRWPVMGHRSMDGLLRHALRPFKAATGPGSKRNPREPALRASRRRTVIYPRARAVLARKRDGQLYRHDFSSRVRVVGQPNGTITLEPA